MWGLAFPVKGYWTWVGPQSGVVLTNWAPSFTPNLPHYLLPICSSTPFLVKAKDEGGVRLPVSAPLSDNQMTVSFLGMRPRKCRCFLLYNDRSQLTSANFYLGDFGQAS